MALNVVMLGPPGMVVERTHTVASALADAVKAWVASPITDA